MKASDNEYPSVLFDEQGSDPATPASGLWRVYTKSDGLYLIDDTGAVTGPFSDSAAGLGAWADYTPVWTATGTAPAIGNGTLVGRKKLLDASTYMWRLRWVAGSTSTFGTGSYIFSLPATSSNNVRQQCYGVALDSSSGDRALVTGTIEVNAAVTLRLVAEAGTSITNLAPWTWASGDELELAGVLEV